MFMMASAGSGAANSLYTLVMFRAFQVKLDARSPVLFNSYPSDPESQGFGAGGIITVVWTILTKLVHPEDRSRWQPFLSLTWSLSAACGPLLGGVFSGMFRAHTGRTSMDFFSFAKLSPRFDQLALGL